MTMATSYEEQVIQISQLFKDIPVQVLMSRSGPSVIVRAQNKYLGMVYVNRLHAAGWMCASIKNQFCDQYLVLVELHDD